MSVRLQNYMVLTSQHFSIRFTTFHEISNGETALTSASDEIRAANLSKMSIIPRSCSHPKQGSRTHMSWAAAPHEAAVLAISPTGPIRIVHFFRIFPRLLFGCINADFYETKAARSAFSSYTCLSFYQSFCSFYSFSPCIPSIVPSISPSIIFVIVKTSASFHFRKTKRMCAKYHE